jgi:hypothetical protein
MPDYQKSAGHQIGQQKTNLTDGLITSWDEMYTSVTADQYQHALPGMYRYVDYNGDGIVDKDDVVPYGYPNRPQYNMNFTVGLSYKNLSLSLQLLGTRNSTLIQSQNDFYAPDYYSSVDRDVFNDMWLPGVDESGPYRVPVYMLAGDAVGAGSYYRKDGTMWRLKNAEIAYNIESKGLDKVGISNINVFVNGNNLFLWSHLNEDRETGGKRGHDSISEIYPLTKRYNFGLRVKF